MNVVSSGVHDKIVAAFEQSTRDIVRRHWKGGSREKLKLIRRALNLTQQEFADVFGLPYASVRNWEQPEKEPTGAAALLIDMIVEDPKVVSDLVARVKRRNSEPAE
ncbi:helix-turn-helix domain-containing protein [Mesorhizobium sp. M0590]|uniref:helix-turn-helix domain-containing protein n=1 Tax=unclassified Mesorhizobium TaxID=325217 RepID=UPI003339AE99